MYITLGLFSIGLQYRQSVDGLSMLAILSCLQVLAVCCQDSCCGLAGKLLYSPFHVLLQSVQGSPSCISRQRAIDTCTARD